RPCVNRSYQSATSLLIGPLAGCGASSLSSPEAGSVVMNPIARPLVAQLGPCIGRLARVVQPEDVRCAHERVVMVFVLGGVVHLLSPSGWNVRPVSDAAHWIPAA